MKGGRVSSGSMSHDIMAIDSKHILMDQEAKQAVYCLADGLMVSLLFYERLLPYGLDIRRTYSDYLRILYRT